MKFSFNKTQSWSENIYLHSVKFVMAYERKRLKKKYLKYHKTFLWAHVVIKTYTVLPGMHVGNFDRSWVFSLESWVVFF